MTIPSPSLSRRRLLAATGGCLSVALAGCAGESDRESTTHHESEDGGAPDSTHEFEVRSVRVDADELVVYQSEESAPDDENGQEGETGPDPNRRSLLFVVDESAATELWIEADDEAEREIRTFVSETEFDTEAIVVDQRPIEDCYRRHVRGVQARDDEFRSQYCRRLKEPTAPCEVDRELMEVLVFRIQRPYEEEPSSRGHSESASCRQRVVAVENRTETEANQSAETGAETEPTASETDEHAAAEEGEHE